jgi:hypothetical protein
VATQALRSDIALRLVDISLERLSTSMSRSSTRAPASALSFSSSSDFPVADLADRGHGYRKGTSTMGGDGEVLRHRGLKSSSLQPETSRLWWVLVPDLGHFRLDNTGIRYSV